MITIKDVARRAGVSVATVSRVLNNSDHPVSDAARERVLAAMQELGFTPNAQARSLHQGHTRSIGLVLPDIANPYYPGIVRGVEDVAQASGYTVMIGNTDRSRQRTQQYLRVLREKRVDGILFAGGGAIDDAGEGYFAPGQGVPAVVIGRHPLSFKSVRVDNAALARAAVQYLLARGHARVATITGPAVSTTAQDRLAGYHDALAAGGCPARPEWVAAGGFTSAGGYSAARAIGWGGEGPTAVFCQNDLMAIGALRALSDLGLNVPGDVAVVGCDDIPLAAYARPALTTMSVPVYDLGATAMRVLLDLLAGQEMEPVTLLPARLVARESA